MKYEFCDGLIFYNSPLGMILPPIQFGDIKLYQIGENVMERGSEVFVHENICSEISYVISGEADFYANGEMHHLKKGDIQVIPKGSIHRIVTDNTKRLRFFYMGFDIVPREEPSHIEKLAEFYDNDVHILRDNGMLIRHFGNFINELDVNDVFNYDMYYSYIKLILIHTFRLSNTPVEAKSAPNAISNDMCGTVFNIVKYIDSNITTISRVSDIANKISYSSSYISRIFRQKMGITISEYISRKKVDKAIELLQNQRLNVNDVASYLNYDSYGSFLKAFKKYALCLPSEYIKNNISDE